MNSEVHLGQVVRVELQCLELGVCLVALGVVFSGDLLCEAAGAVFAGAAALADARDAFWCCGSY